VNRRFVWLSVAAGCVVAVLILAPFFSSRSERSGPAGLAGEPAPVYALRDDRGAAVSLATYRGRVVVMNLWASWCPPCRAEMPDLQRLADAYGKRGISVIGVNQGESPERARAFARSLAIAFPVWIDAEQRYGRTFAAMGLPTTVIIGRDGKVVRGFDGALSFAQMRSSVEPLAARQ
jgi:cytochrome c biogenesis protein CcmG/thiol:disulfide interchange protein DsbE